MANRICKLFNIKYPIIQGGMVWCSGYKLVSAVSNAGGLGLLGAGSMRPDFLRKQIRKTKAETQKPFGVNVPLLYPDIEEIIQVIVEEGVQIVFTSAGNPKTWTKYLQDKGILVAHVIANSKFAQKADEAGVDAIVAEGFEAGGHNGREETTSMVLIPAIRMVTAKPLIAAGGIATGRGLLAAMILGADGVQIGSRFVASEESSAHPDFKKAVIEASEGSTSLMLKKLVPVRLLKNSFSESIFEAEKAGKSSEELAKLLGRGRAKSGMLEGNLDEGELEIGQVSSLISSILPVKHIMDNIILEYRTARAQMSHIRYDF